MLCQSGHEPITHSEAIQCPLCRAVNAIAELESRLAVLEGDLDAARSQVQDLQEKLGT